MEDYLTMRSKRIIILVSLTLLIFTMGCVKSKYKTRSAMTEEEIEEIENIYNPPAEEENDLENDITSFLEGVDGTAMRVNGLSIDAQDLRNLYTFLLDIRGQSPAEAKRNSVDEFIRIYAVMSQWPDTIDIAVTRLNEILDQVNTDGAIFAYLTAENSQEPGADQSAGDLGEIRYDGMVPNFEMHTFTDPIGEVSGPFPTVLGWHLILVSERSDENTDEANAKASHLLLFHGLDPEYGPNISDFITRWANMARIEILADELYSLFPGLKPRERTPGQTGEFLNPSDTSSPF